MHWLRIIATDLYARLIEARSISPGIWVSLLEPFLASVLIPSLQPKTIVLGVRDERFQTRHRQAAFPATNSLTIDHILKQGERLMKEFMSERKGKVGLVGNLSLSFAGLERAERGQQAIQGFFGANGANTSRAGSEVPMSKKAAGKRKASDDMVDLTLESSDIEEAKPQVGTPSTPDRLGSTDSDDIAEVKPDGPVYQCERCGAVISLQYAAAAGGDEAGGTDTAKQVAKEKHENWHAEQDTLQKQPQKKKVKREESTAAASTLQKKIRKKGQQKLKSFFKKS